MAMTQTAVGVPEPSWDDTIVPTLRKRLQQESRALTQRMSTISITSSTHEGADNSTSDHPRLSMSSQRPTQSPPPPDQARTSTDRARPMRSRTYSQPLAFQNKSAAGNSSNRLGSPGSPAYVKPTRIPQPTRSPPPIHQNGFAEHKPHSPSLSASIHQNGLTPTLPTPSRQPSGILREPAPFDPDSESRSDLYYEADEGAENPPKVSMDSEEHPYEHWYRGESSRNGGVGELRVGRRQEMLDIANYGHEVRARKQAYAAQREAQLRAQSRELSESGPRRKRADSVGADSRCGSLYEEDEEDMDQIYDSYYGENQDEPVTTSLDINRSITPSHIPRPSSRQRTTPTPTQSQPPGSRYHGSPPSAMSSGPGMQRGASEPPPSASRIGGASPVLSPDKRGRKNMNMSVESSPASANSNKKMNATAMNRAKKERERKEREKERRSVAQYPVAEFDGDMADAIPSWTQPIKAETSGNWDDVVLPAVARKKGLNGYVVTDGSPKVQEQQQPVEPAPGTFGYNHDKYRPSRGDLSEIKENIPLDELGPPTEGRENVTRPISTQEIPSPPRKPLGNGVPPDSPAPFAHYMAPPTPYDQQEAHTMRPPPPQEEPEEKSGGCCKCIIM